MTRIAGKNTPELLVIRLSSLGDVALTLPAVAVLRDLNPAARIVFLTKEPYTPLVAAFPGVDEVVSLPPMAAGIGGTLRLARKLRARRFAAVFDLHGSLRSRLIAAMSNAPQRARAGGRGVARRWIVLQATVRRLLRRRRISTFPADSGRPLVALAAARAVAPRLRLEDLPRPVLRIPPLAFNEAQGRLAAVAHPRVAVCPGARHRTKRWPGFQALVAALVNRRAGVVVVLGPDDIWEGPEGAPVVRGPLSDLMAILAACDVAVANDSGLAHVAAAVGTPAAVIFGGTVPEFGFAPTGRHRVVEYRDLECRPCSVHGRSRCPRSDFACLTGISTAAVLAAIDGLTGSLGGGSALHPESSLDPAMSTRIGMHVR